MIASRYRPHPDEPKTRDHPRSRTTREIPAATTARIAGFDSISHFEFVDHHGSGCSGGSGGWFFSCRARSWDEAHAVRQAEPEFDAYIAFENPRYRPELSMTEEAKARIRGTVQNHAGNPRPPNPGDHAGHEPPLTPSGRSGAPKTRKSGGQAG